MPPPQRSPPDQPSHQQSPPHSDTLCLNPAFSPSYPFAHTGILLSLCLGSGNRSLQVTSVSLAPNIESGASRSIVLNMRWDLGSHQCSAVHSLCKPFKEKCNYFYYYYYFTQFHKLFPRVLHFSNCFITSGLFTFLENR